MIKKLYKRELYYKITIYLVNFMINKLHDNRITRYKNYIKKKLHNKTLW